MCERFEPGALIVNLESGLALIVEGARTRFLGSRTALPDIGSYTGLGPPTEWWHYDRIEGESGAHEFVIVQCALVWFRPCIAWRTSAVSAVSRL